MTRLALARLPTPLHPLARSGPGLWIKRDDLTGVALSGNKIRKLEYLLAEAQAQEADTVITCGATSSNHARATAVAAAQLGLDCHLVLRGARPAAPQGNLLLDRIVGAKVHYISMDQWRQRDQEMASIAEQLRTKGKRPYLIPEGGSSAVGSLGYVRAAQELLEQITTDPPRRVFVATGSGGTCAGLALGLAHTDIEVFAVAVCDDRAYFDQRVNAILDEALALGLTDADTKQKARWTIVEGYKGEGYGKATDEELRAIAAFARKEGIFVDPVYTGKALNAFLEMAPSMEGSSVFWHTGGVYELFDFSEAFEQALPP